MTAIFIGLSFLALVIIGSYVSEMLKQLGATEEKLRQKEKQDEIDKKRGEIMAQPRTDDETINSLDDGSF